MASDHWRHSSHAETNTRLNNVPIVILDGSTGTYLEDRYGVEFDESKPAWSSSVDLKLISKVHSDYLEAGADIIETATYQVTLANATVTSGDQQDRNQDGAATARARLKSLLREAVDAVDSRSSVDGTPVANRRSTPTVALSIGAYGGTMKPSTEYTGEYPPEMRDVGALREHFVSRIKPYYEEEEEKDEEHPVALSRQNLWSSISYVAFETFVSADEVSAARETMGVVYADLESSRQDNATPRWWICVNYPDNSPSGLLSPSGDAPKDIARASLCASGTPSRIGVPCPQPWGIGINCTKLHKVAALVKQYENAIDSLIKNENEASSQSYFFPWLVLYPDGAHNLRYNSVTKAWDPIERNNSADGKSPERSWAMQMKEILQEITLRGKWPGIVVGGCCKTTPEDIKELIHCLHE